MGSMQHLPRVIYYTSDFFNCKQKYNKKKYRKNLNIFQNALTKDKYMLESSSEQLLFTEEMLL